MGWSLAQDFPHIQEECFYYSKGTGSTDWTVEHQETIPIVSFECDDS